MEKFAENVNLGKRVLPPPPVNSEFCFRFVSVRTNWIALSYLIYVGSGGIEKSHSCKWAKWIQWHALPHIQQSTQQRNKGYYPNLHGWDFSIPPSPVCRIFDRTTWTMQHVHDQAMSTFNLRIVSPRCTQVSWVSRCWFICPTSSFVHSVLNVECGLTLIAYHYMTWGHFPDLSKQPLWRTTEGQIHG